MFGIVLTQSNLQSQNNVQIDSKHSSLSKYDTNYIYKYESKLV